MLALSEQSRIDWTRWQKAQQYERGFWQRLGDSIDEGTTGPLDWYKWRARRLEELLTVATGRTPRAGKVLEIGSGPIGIVNFLEWGERFAIDPLEPFYREQRSLVGLRRPDTTYLAGSGEQLPFDDGACSVVIIDNVIDHTFEPDRILREIARVLEPGGQLYLSVNIHTTWGAILHNLLAVLHVDKGHPYTFTRQVLRQFVARGGFRVEYEQIGDYLEARQADRQSHQLTDRIKGYTGLSEFQHLVICAKATAAGH